ncbi:MAG: diguanylate cyclase [Armatimonadetes bacterium]|nr:diguanylate cyclase [Armatimonadota bacterium]
MQLLSDLALIPVWVNSTHLVLSARLLMQGHNLKAIPVLEEGKVVGVITLAAATKAPEKDTVASAMIPSTHVFEGDTPLAQAAQEFVDHQLEFVPVVHNSAILGILTPHILIGELRRTWDPLTGLGWSDRLREWGTEILGSGQEISILFVDIDQFGAYNKLHGHVVGDRVLKIVADMLAEATESNRDVLVRYGGDEFAIGTLRSQSEVGYLRERLHNSIVGQSLGEGIAPVTISVGISGGRRAKIREDAHIASMLDELITNASQDAIARKKTPRDRGQEFPHSNTPEETAFRPRFDPS